MRVCGTCCHDHEARARSARVLPPNLPPSRPSGDYGRTQSDRTFKDIMAQALTDDHKDVKLMTYRDLSFNLEQIQSTMRYLYLDNLSRRNANDSKNAGHGAAMMAEPTSRPRPSGLPLLQQAGHYQRGCALFAKNKEDRKPAFKRGKAGPEGTAGKKWCSTHDSTTHNDVDCYQQGAPRPQEGAYHTTATPNSNIELTAGGNIDPDLNKELHFEGGFMWMVLSDGRTFLPNNSEITMLVDRGATEHLRDDELLLELEEQMLNYTILNTPKKIRAAGKQISYCWAPPLAFYSFSTYFSCTLSVRIEEAFVKGDRRTWLGCFCCL
ncbi:unnamed protein product [Laminaria digitata]